jgi:MarR family transcriptional regulator, 2-MHQ and catechol-resistance regulon repressor
MPNEDPECFAPFELWFQIVRTHRVLDRLLSALPSAAGLTIAQTEILAMLDRLGPTPQTHLSDGMAVTKGNVAQVVDRLHNAGMIIRSEIDGNRRANLLTITPKGKELLDQVMPNFMETLEELFSKIPEDRQRMIIDDLAALEIAAKNIS